MSDPLRLPAARDARRAPATGSLLAGPTAKAEAIAGSDMAAMVSEFDWAATPLGPADEWPQSLKSAVRLILGSRYPMFIWWGPQLVAIYNDAYVDVLGPRHPWALGRGARETWAELWDVLGPQGEAVMQHGASTWNDRVLLVMERKGFVEETYFTFSYSPCFNDQGEVGGVFCTCTEETGRVLGERRLKSLGELATAVLDSRNAQDTCARAARALADNTHDLPFVQFYLQDSAHTARLVAGSGAHDPLLAAPEVSLLDPGAHWPFHAVAASREPQLVGDIELRAHVPAGPWPEPVQDALVLPMPSPTPGGPGGFMVAGLNPRRPLDADYRAWLVLVAQQVASAVADARSFEEEQMRARALAELDRAKTTFFSNVSHELRTPLALMLGPVGELLQDPALDEGTQHSLALVHRNGRRLQRLVNTLLDFSRIEAGRMQARFQPLDLAGFTAELASFFDSAAGKAGLDLDIRCEPLTAPVYVDRTMWERIVFNLLSNAIKYTLHGRISVRLGPTPTGARLEVADTGVGIPPEALGRVFERFYRVEGAPGRSIEGTGIGLALVAELVRMHGGTVQVESRLGEGSVFTVDLRAGFEHLPSGHVVHEPARAAASPQGWLDEVESWLGAESPQDAGLPPEAGISEPAPLFEPRTPGERGLVLLVDDNPDMRTYLSRLLGREHDVCVASDGWQALQSIGEQKPDLVVTDMMMARMDGFELLRRLREDAATATLPVIMISANAAEDARVRALEAGADDFLVKPFHARELLARVSGTMRLTQVRRDAMQREQELRAEVENVLESIAEGFVAVDADWRFTYVNRAAESIYGRSREQLIGRELWEVFPEAASSRFQEPFRRAMLERTPVTAEGPYNELSGWFEINVYPVASGGLAFYFRDVLQTRLMERSIRQSEAQQRFLSEFGTLMQRIEDPEQVLDEAVRALGEHLQADRCVWALVDEDEDTTEFLGEFRREDMPSLLGRMRLSDLGSENVRLYRAGRPFVVHDIDSDERIAPGRERYRAAKTLATISAGILRGRRIVAGVGVHQREPRHWTESEVQLVQAAAQRCWEAFERAKVQRRQREDAEALAQAHAALQQVERRKDQFIATLAHELRNPLAPLRNGVQLLALGGGPDGGARVQAMMRRQIDQLVRLVDDLLEVSRITSGKVVLQRTRLPLHEVLTGAADSSRPVVEAARHSLHVDVDGTAGLYVDGDAMRLGQVFANLLNNAAKYTEPGGHIAMSAWREGEEAVVQVQDNGMGLAPDMLEEVFQPFVQADRSASRAQGGLGIGLSIVRSLVELHGGRVRARSEGLGRGCTFEVRLPVAHGSLQAPQPNLPGGGSRTPLPEGPSVLVVDDNRDAADSLGYMLEMMGARTRVVYGGPDALAAVEAEAPALVLLDLGMPGMDGYQVVRRLAGHPKRDRMHIVALTGWGQAEDRQRTREAGFDEHLVKPAELDKLEALVARVAAPAAA
ncbi:response regulator [Ramlibacter henchirensis]|uniref:histidine kinase n=1 Tax=Ramlibacter henchirensis TaxID=204072 RepID=A0A4Z0C7A4_9BURK|nr:ATP-binding protein [Ramlibacter henchirensis]TFZ06350.1 response regulator [Ramlibacter henchirensis]